MRTASPDGFHSLIIAALWQGSETPPPEPVERTVAEVEGWILGVGGLTSLPETFASQLRWAMGKMAKVCLLIALPIGGLARERAHASSH